MAKIVINKMLYFQMIPSEVIISIFEYLTPDELYQSFSNLNNNINNILRSMNKMSLTISDNSSTVIRFFRGDQFIRVIIDYNLSKKVNLSYLTSELRSLTIPHPVNNQMEYINGQNFPFIEYLSIQGPSSLLCHFIFSNCFENLLKVNLIYIDISLQWSRSPSIRFINLLSDDPWAFIRIIESCPNLHTFLYKGGSIPSVYKLVQPHLILKELSIRINFCPSFDKDESLDLIFSLFPNLMKICLHFCHQNSDLSFNIVSLSELLRRCVPQLIYLYMKIENSPPLFDIDGYIHPLLRHIGYSYSTMIISSEQIDLKRKLVNKSKNQIWL